MPTAQKISYYTHTGRHLTAQEHAFIGSYVKCKNGSQAVQEAGYKNKAPAAKAVGKF